MNSHIHSGNSISPFCDVTDLGCTVDKLFVGQCSLSTFTGNLPAEYRVYFYQPFIYLFIFRHSSAHPSIIYSYSSVCLLLVHVFHPSITLFISSIIHHLSIHSSIHPFIHEFFYFHQE